MIAGTDGPRYEPYLDTPSAEFRWRLGLRELELDDWLQFDEHAEAELAEKRRLLDEHRATVFCVEHADDVFQASTEVRDAIHDAVPPRFAVVDDGLHPLDAAGRMVQEDLVLMVERDGGLVCGGGSVCFPNRWHLPDKVGRTMSEIHEPVPELNAQLERPIDRTLARLAPDKSYWRLGWTVIGTDDLYQPLDGTAAPHPPIENPSDYWLRVERETLRRFPNSNAVLFTIRTYLSLIRDVPFDSRERLAAAIGSMSPQILEYKGLADAGDIIAEWLRSHDSSGEGFAYDRGDDHRS